MASKYACGTLKDTLHKFGRKGKHLNKSKKHTTRKALCLVKSSKSCFGQIFRPAILKYSKKRLLLNFQRSMFGGNQSYPGVQLAA